MSEVDVGINLDPNIAQQLVKPCEDLIAEFRRLIVSARKLRRVDGFGTLGSGLALQGKFAGKAVGGPDSLVNALESHIAVVDDMRAYFQKCIDDAKEQEQANVDSLRKISPGN
ncbi:hypothetical protein [Rhodococcus sp. 24CO]|uniref:hypothetical protein n=1 Tax=Rhodococcus sp. 24CO TaxID=3117460 RepID=UPI003D34148F